MEKVLLSLENKIAIITLNRPEKRNALNQEIWTGLEKVVKEINTNEDIRVVVLKGEGKTFCAGLDLSLENPLAQSMQFSSPSKAEKNFYELIKRTQNIYNQIEKLPAPVICVIQGAAIGGGLELALACDIRLASDDAIFSIPEIKFGLIPDLGGTQRLPKIVGIAKAKELIYTGKRISAKEAKEIGLVNEIYPKENLLDEANKMVEEISLNAPLAVRGSKRAIAQALDYPQEIGLDYEAFLNAKCLISDDVKEGFLSYFQKKTPDFKGK